jgi:hypothetical protein
MDKEVQVLHRLSMQKNQCKQQNSFKREKTKLTLKHLIPGLALNCKRRKISEGMIIGHQDLVGPGRGQSAGASVNSDGWKMRKGSPPPPPG